MTAREENIVNIALLAGELLKEGKIERPELTGHSGLIQEIILMADAFEQKNAGVDYDAEGRDYWIEIDSFAEEQLLKEFGVSREASADINNIMPSDPVKVYAVAGSAKHEVYSGNWDECKDFYDEHNGCYLDDNCFEWSLEIEDEREASFPEGYFDAIDHYCELAGTDLETEFVRQHPKELVYCWENGLFMKDFEAWTGFETLLDEKLTFEEASVLIKDLHCDFKDYSTDDVFSIQALIAAVTDLRNSNCNRHTSLDSMIGAAAQKADKGVFTPQGRGQDIVPGL